MMEDIKVLTDEELEAKYPYEFFYHYSKISEYKIRTHNMEVPWQGQLHYKNIWIYGPPGTGKSKWANSLTSPMNIYHKKVNKWWDGYQFDNHHLVLIEDWPSDKQMLGQQLKIWGDRYQFIGECKGSHLTIDPGRFFLVITSNYKPDECFLPGDVNAILRRFQVIHMESEQTIIPFTSLDKRLLTS